MSEQLNPNQLALYFYPSCPFCRRVLKALDKMGLTPDLAAGDAGGIALKDTLLDAGANDELIRGGGKRTVPCLRIERDGEVEWLYESLDIIAFLETQVKH